MALIRIKSRGKRLVPCPLADRISIPTQVVLVVAVVGTILVVNVHLSHSLTTEYATNIVGVVGAGFSKGNVNRVGVRGSIHVAGLPLPLSPLPDDNLPALDTKTRTPLNVTAWDEWAAEPLLGSFLVGDSSRTSIDHRTLIHMPFVDLQSIYPVEAPAHPMLQQQSFPSPDCVVLTRKGDKLQSSGVRSNQDRIAIAQYRHQDNNDDFWMGLFDGHGDLGHVLAHFALAEFPKHIQKLHSQLPPTTTSTSAKTIERTKQAIHDMVVTINNQLPRLYGAGSTAISIWKRHDQVFISNVGDSKAFVVSVDNKHRVQVVYTTKPHKPNDPLERQRIEGMGGQVQDPPAPQFSARVLIPMGGGPFMNVLGLAMSRSLGDFEGHPYGIIPDPTTDVIALADLDPHLDYLIILASDGLLDKVSELEIATKMAASQLLTPNAPISSLQAAEQLILQSSQAWDREFFGVSYRDDISLAVNRLRL